MLEQELKLRPGARFGLVELPGRELPERELTSTYHDTDDLRLARGAVTLRRREQEGETPVWQLKLPRGADRLELEWQAPDMRVPGEITELVTAHTRGRPLSAVATLRTRRSGVLLQEDGADVAEVVHDIVEVLDDDRPPRSFEEIEVELVGDDRKARAPSRPTAGRSSSRRWTTGPPGRRPPRATPPPRRCRPSCGRSTTRSCCTIR
jgi:hypothetical protein